MRWIAVIALSAVIVGTFTVVGARYYRTHIERDLIARTSVTLSKQQIAIQTAKFDGRDGTLIIEKSDAHSARDVQKAAESVFGVRVAKVQEIVKEEPSFQIERIGAHLRMSGQFAEKDWIRQFEARAGEVFGASNVQSSLQENKMLKGAPYLSALLDFIPLLERVGPESKLGLADRLVTLTGLVPDVEIKDEVEKTAREHLPPGLRFESLLAVPERRNIALRSPDLVELLDAIRLHFEFDSTRLTKETSGNLELLSQALGEQKGGKIRILGYADSIGTERYNYRLSRRRADEIRRKLCKKGFAVARFEIRARGEKDPVADNATAEGRQLNRRVAVVLGGKR